MTRSAKNEADVSLVLLNGKVWCGPHCPQAQAVAVAGGRIVAVGDDAEIRSLVRPGAKIIDLGGARLLGGFFDCHLHLLGGGFLLSQVNLRDAADEAEFGRRLATHAKTLAAGQWVLGGNWDENVALAGRLPSRDMLDGFVADRPVFVRRYDGHIAACNSRAMESAGIGPATADPAGGRIDRGAAGRPTGVLRDAAIGLVNHVVPRPDQREVERAALAAMDHARRCGLVQVDDLGGSRLDVTLQAIQAYRDLDRQGQMTLRVNVFLPLEMVQQRDWRDVAAGMDGPHVRFGGFKAFYDGSLGARTALFFEPYRDAEDTCGICVTPRERLAPLVTRADAEGLPVAVHAIGDRAVREVMDVFESAIRANGLREGRRLRVEHAQHVHPADVGRFGRPGVIASMQPYHAIDDARFAERCLGPQRLAEAYPWRSLLQAGAHLAFGSDWPVATLDVLAGIDAAVNRRSLDGLHPEGWLPRQCISVQQAAWAYTGGAAYAARSQGGLVQPGMPADMVVLSRDIFDPAERDRIAETTVTQTIVGGQVWDSPTPR